MPSVGMRRSTRVFGVVKGVDGARVLRSGRRLLIGAGENKFKRANDGDEWLHTMIKNHHHNHNNSPIMKCNKENGWTQTQTHVSKLKKERPSPVALGVGAGAGNEVAKKVNDSGNKMWGIVYSRKRRRMSGIDKLEILGRNKKFGIQFSRRQRRRVLKDNEVESFEPALLGIIVDGSCSSSGLAASFLHLVLGYIRRTNLSIAELVPFLLSESVKCAFASDGLRFLQDTTANRNGICKIFGGMSTVPIFSLDFSAVPFCFLCMHLRLAFRVKCLSFEPVNNSLDEDSSQEVISESEEDHSCGLVRTDTFLLTDNSGGKVSLHPSLIASKLAGRHSQYRNVLNSRGIQKRRSAFRRRRARNPSGVGIHKANGALVSDLISSRKNGIPFSTVVSKDKLRRSLRLTPAANLKEVNPTAVQTSRVMDSSSCSANLLVIESDRCYRMVGATVALEISDLKEWVLVVKKDGLTRCTHLAQKSMRPCSSNRITHDVIWTGDDSWKLEFPNRQDWLIFKDLYKECYDRNVPAPISKAIPVPGVREVLGYEDSSSLPFSRQDAYISFNNDEVVRALTKRTANYDMDCEDEEWLKKFNSEFFVESEEQEHLSEEKFELMIDTLERAFYSSPDDFVDGRAAVNFCIDLGRREVVEAVYGYWMKKQKQRRSALLRVFQLHQGKKASLIPKPGLRKRRSFKRQASQFGRGKKPSLLQAMAAEHDALEEQNAMRNLEAAKASAKSSVESAILKRRRAQMLMENADLAVYKAAMALRIAEAARTPNSTVTAEIQFLD
ncbi:uncharacterized protein LOC8275962 [Ricinus communis]|uniref:Enhancer of polycomb-like protein n=1 Tax=Ricinus communis TaxID=3988 RepID=B9T193_RICCO|nr:uncharacterized protein LOC8275962 [Ricinus communis]EEF30368.1 conserved hypothetical protein [Ricinus communis]|eukprot:XP_002532013.1 uncharacterized protein LOC8275962 [Ricinus communis]